MSLSKPQFEQQPTTLARLVQIRYAVETALRAVEEGSLDLPTCDVIALNLLDALRLLRAAEGDATRPRRLLTYDELTPQQQREVTDAFSALVDHRLYTYDLDGHGRVLCRRPARKDEEDHGCA